MPELLDWQHVDTPPAAIRSLVRVLRRGHVLVLPSETGYLVAASALRSESLQRLRQLPFLAEGEPLQVGVPGPAAARDWIPELGRVGLRLARRLWPGPLVLSCRDSGAGLSGRLPTPARALLGEGDALELYSPDHDAPREILRTSPVPLALAPVPRPEGDVSLRQLLAPVLQEVDLVVGDGLPPLSGPPTVVGLDGESWRVARPGTLPEDQLREQAACLIVFVCTGNTCRSPLAEALCKQRLASLLGCPVAELPARGFLVTSAGLAAAPGMPAAEEAVAVARDCGGDLEQHCSKPLSADLAARADHLICMTRSHLRALQDHYPDLGSVPRLLSQAGDDLADPVGLPRSVYEECARQIDRDLEALVPTLIPPPSTRDAL